MNDYQSIFNAATALPVADKLRLIDALSSLVPDDQPPSLGPEWAAEIRQRSDQIDQGLVTTRPWPEVREELRRRAAGNEAG